jgi:5'-methylthioadenosine phosphorylase
VWVLEKICKLVFIKYFIEEGKLMKNKIVFGVISENRIDMIQGCLSRGGEVEDLKEVVTSFGILKKVYYGKLTGYDFIYIPYNGRCEDLNLPEATPAIFDFFHKNEITHILSVGLVGSVNRLLNPGDIVIPHDLIDFTKYRMRSILEKKSPGITLNYRSNEIYCSVLKKIIYNVSLKYANQSLRVFDRAVYVCTEGPRFETPAEIKMFEIMGGDIVAFSAGIEALIAREYNMCYANLSLVSNYGEGISNCNLDNLGDVSKEFKEVISTNILFDGMDYFTTQITSYDCSCKNSWITKPVMR